MPAPVILEHNLESGVARNLRIELTFNGPLDPDTVLGSNVILSQPDPLAPALETDLEYVPGAEPKIYIRPLYLLDALTAYRVTIGAGLHAEDETPSEGEAVNFTTGETYEAPEVDTPASAAWAEATGAIEGYHLVSVEPADGSYGHPTDPDDPDTVSELVLEFSDAPDPDDWPEDPETWADLPVRLKVFAIDGDPARAVRTPLPTATAIDGNTVTITLSSGEGLIYNTGRDPEWEEASQTVPDLVFSANSLVQLTVKRGQGNAGGTSTLASDQLVHFSTELFPLYSTVRRAFARTMAIAAAAGFAERDLEFLLFQESAWIAEILAGHDEDFNPAIPECHPLTIRDYVEAKAAWRLASDTLISFTIQGSSQDKQLGPFRVSRSYGSPVLLTKMVGDLESRWRELLAILVPTPSLVKATQGVSSPYMRLNRPDALFLRRQFGTDVVPTNPWGRTLPNDPGLM